MTLDPNTGSLGFSFAAGHTKEDVNATLERLLELPAELAAERGRRVALVFDEFQQVIGLDPGLPALMRAVFQSQPDVSHVYLGSKRSLMAELFNDVNEPFWRSAKHIELGPIPADAFAAFIAERFAATGKKAPPAVVDAVLEITHGHPYGTQELCYALWEETPRARRRQRRAARAPRWSASSAPRTRTSRTSGTARRARSGSCSRRSPPSRPTRSRARSTGTGTGCRRGSSVHRALEALVEDELVAREGPGRYRIVEPFLAEWVRRYGA